jgi:gluconolactonase
VAVWFIAFLLAGAALGQNFDDLQIQKVGAGLRFTEGPAWSLEGFLLFSDTVTDQLHKFIPGKGVEPLRPHAGGPSGNAYDDDGRLYTCEARSRRVVRTLRNGKMEVVADKFEGKRFNAPNGIVVRRDGVVYFTDPAFGNQQDTRELDFYGIFRVRSKGEIDTVARWKTRPNGIALSQNGRTLYVSDADERVVRVYDLDRAGAATNERVFVSKIPGVPGGLVADEKGNLYVAARHVYAYSPKGDLLREIELGETPSNLTFGDLDFMTLFVTARTSLYRMRLGVKGALQHTP